jgi:hypothetical protein
MSWRQNWGHSDYVAFRLVVIGFFLTITSLFYIYDIAWGHNLENLIAEFVTRYWP